MNRISSVALILCSLIQIFFHHSVFAQLNLGQSQGIFRAYQDRPATDLVFQGKRLTPEEVHALWLKSPPERRLDISKLEPDTTTDLWKNTFPKELPDSLDDLDLYEMEEVSYIGHSSSPTASSRFTVRKVLENGQQKTFNIGLSKLIGNQLMMKTVLRKIGYTVPAIKWLPSLRIKFRSDNEIKRFRLRVEKFDLAGKLENWLVSQEGTTLLLQDIIVIESTNTIFNLAAGKIVDDGTTGVSEDLIQGKRIFSALSVPLALLNVPDSVNFFRWEACRIADKRVDLQHPQAPLYRTTWEDARWMVNRLARLTRDDWSEVALSANVPREVATVMTEKLIARRNSLLDCFDLNHKKLAVIPSDALNDGAKLYRGKITQKSWPGYARRFAQGDPETPLSPSEMSSWVWSKVIQTGIDTAVSYVNSLPDLGTNIEAMNQENLDRIIEEYKKNPTGDPQHLPIAKWHFPTIRGGIILTRNISTGTYLGTDNKVSLVDAIGVNVEAGQFFGFAGLPTPLNLSATVSASYSRIYAHLKPVFSLKKARNYPFKNIMVPLLKGDYAGHIKDIITTEWSEVDSEEKAKKIQALSEKLKKDLEIGESILVTDTINFGGKLRLGASTDYYIKAQLGLAPEVKILSRFHVHRRSENVVQIYQDLGGHAGITIDFRLNTVFPVGNISWKPSALSKGIARTKMYSLSLSAQNPKAVEHFTALYHALMTSDTDAVKEESKPWQISHDFEEGELNWGLLFWKWSRLDAFNELKVTHPEGEEKKFFRAHRGSMSGRDYLNYGFESVRLLLALFAEFDFTPSTSSTNPGVSFKGSSVNQLSYFDGQLNQTTGLPEQPFMRLSRIWSGWEISRLGAYRLLDKIKQKYEYAFFAEQTLDNSQVISLYAISVNFLIYEKAINYLKNLSEAQIRDIFKYHASSSNLLVRPAEDSLDDQAAKEFLRLRARWLERERKNNLAFTDEALQAINYAENNLNLQGLSLLFGGEENFYVTSRIDGFRSADEDGNNPIQGHTFGRSPDEDVLGPLQRTINDSNMLEGEFHIYWLMTRLL